MRFPRQVRPVDAHLDIAAETATVPLLSADYPETPGVYDEMAAAPGILRPHWDEFIKSLSALGAPELTRRWQTARQRIRENGVTYNVYGDPLGMDRPWNLDAIPLLIAPSEWQQLEAGLIQRARLLNLILADLYGPQKLLHGGQIPAALVFGNPGFWRSCHGINVRDNTYLHLLAVDLARGPGGDWWVISDRTQAPSGAGYSARKSRRDGGNVSGLIPRISSQTSRIVFQSLFEIISSDFRRRLRSTIRASCSLTPGPFNETYFEQILYLPQCVIWGSRWFRW